MTKTTRPFAQRRLSGGMPCFFYYNIYIYIYSYDKNDTIVLLATRTCGMPCFFNYDVVILVAKTMRFVNVA